MEKSTNTACPACKYGHRRCHPNCYGLEAFKNIISREDYQTIFSIFQAKPLAKRLTDVPEPRYSEILHSYLLEAKERTNNPLGGCDARMKVLEKRVEDIDSINHHGDDDIRLASLEKKFEEIYWRVAALETRLDGGSSSADFQSRLTALEARLDEGPSRTGTSVPPAVFGNHPLSSHGGRKRKALEDRLDEGPSDARLDEGSSEAGPCSPSVPPTGFFNLLMSGISPEAEIQVIPPPPPPPVYPLIPPPPASLDALQGGSPQSFEVGQSSSHTGAAAQSPDWDLDNILDFSDEERQILHTLWDR